MYSRVEDISDEEPFLRSLYDRDGDSSDVRGIWGISVRSITLHALVAALYMVLLTAAFYALSMRETDHLPDELVYSPAREAMAYEVHNLDPSNFYDNPFVGDPRPELDEAWNGLMQNIHLRVTDTEYERLKPQINRTSAQLAGGNGYVIGLGVYHELHCLKYIRQWIHRDHYWPTLVGAALEERKSHIEHCLELFRLNSMCSASLAPSTFDWLQTDPPILTPHQHGLYERKCVNWEKLDGWASQRRVDVTNMSIFQVPESNST